MEKFDNTEYFSNREISWLKFNRRVLNEARDLDVQLFERLKFLSITSSNLDEFFMVRIASLKDMVAADYKKKDISGMTAGKQLEILSKETHNFVNKQYEVYNNSLIPMLKDEGLYVYHHTDVLNEEEKSFINEYFDEFVYPVLTPMAVDASRPFPLVRNKTLNIAALIRKKEDKNPKKKKKDVYLGNVDGDMDFAMVQVPSVLPRIVEIPSDDKRKIIYLEDIIEKNIDKLFLNYEVISASTFRVMRNAEFKLDEEEALDLLEEIKKKLKRRQWGEAIRLEVEERMNPSLLGFLKDQLEVDDEDVFRIKGPLDLTVLMKIYALEGFDNLRAKKHAPVTNVRLIDCEDIFASIREKDILLSHPYESFDPVIDFVSKAACDKNVLAIKQTLYRVSGNSPIIKALANAADNGKQVTVLVELKARFDEENNINWARMLEKAGCHVIYGLVGLKTHSKITLVVRREEDGIRRYVHLGTGNYNDSTAKLYTDLGMFTARESYGEDATAVFNMLSGYSEPPSWKRFVVAPLWMKDIFLKKIRQCGQAALAGKEVKITVKMNSLSDKDIIEALYAASFAGVMIDLIIRGICCLRVGIKGVSENIHVRSIVGTFLEHARIFYFKIDNEEEILLGSADWMNRNLEKRVEIVFPVADEDIKNQIKHYLKTELADNVKASVLLPDDTYVKVLAEGNKKNSQEIFVKEAIDAYNTALKSHKDNESRTFTPMQGE